MKTVYLTIDDAPSPDMGRKIEFLQSRHIPAIWFCRGELLRKRPEPVIDAVKCGHIIGNHSFDHPRFSRITHRRGISQIERTDSIIDGIYCKARVPRPGKLFRFPYGDKGGTSRWFYRDYLVSRDFYQPSFRGIRYPWFTKNNLHTDPDVFWTFDAAEYRISNPGQILARLNATRGRRGGCLRDKTSSDIILIHDFKKTTRLFYQIIDALLGMGFIFKLPLLGSS